MRDRTIDASFWKDRFSDIVNYEEYLQRQGFEVIKIFIHISKDEQKKRLLRRFSDPKKVWKISSNDIHERKFWTDYQHAYQQCIQHTSTARCPWYIVPGDDVDNARILIAQILVLRFEKMKLEYPKLNHEQKKSLKKLERLLEND